MAWLTLDRKDDPYNMVDRTFGRALRETFFALDAHPKIKVLVITGRGRVFSTGADIEREFPQLSAAQAGFLSRDGHLTLSVLETISVFSIAAINGLCLAGGLELAMACSYRIAVKSARLGQTELQVGVIPGWGGSQRLARIVGRSKALRMILTAEIVGGEEAHRMGLVDEVVPSVEKLRERAEELAKKVARWDRELIRLAKESVDIGLQVPLWYALQLESRNFERAWELPAREAFLGEFLRRRQRGKGDA